MNKFAFFFPAKIAFTEYKIDLEPLIFRDKTFYLGPIGKKIYFSCDKNKMVSTDNGDGRQIYIKIGEYFCEMTNTPFLNVLLWLENRFDAINESLPKWTAQIDNPSLYEQEAAKTREKIKVERAIQDAEIQKQKQQRFEKAEQAHKEAVSVFKDGKHMIEWADFERACKENGVKLPIKTLGFGRANILKIGQTGYSICGSKHNSPVLWAAIRDLAAKLAD